MRGAEGTITRRRTPRSQLAAPAALVALAASLGAGAARAQEEPTADRAPGEARPADAAEAALRADAEALQGALALVAASRGAAAARQALGVPPPARVAAALEALAQAPRAADVRALGQDLELQADLVAALLAERPQAQGDLQRWLDDLLRRLERDLAALDAAYEPLLPAATAASAAAAGREVASRRALAARPEGPRLLALAAAAPLVRADLARARAGLLPGDEAGAAGQAVDPIAADQALHALLLARLERRPDPAAGAALALLPRAGRALARELAALGDRGRVARRGADARARLARTAATLAAATDAAVEAARHARDEELRRVLGQQRGPELEDAVRLVAAYRRQFHEPPSLRAAPWWDVYEDTRTARVHFWVDGADRWVHGHARVDPVAPLVQALLAARDPALRAASTQPQVLAALYGAFDPGDGSGEGPPFAEGLAALAARARVGAARVAALRDLGRRAGHAEGAVDAALAARVGLPPGPLEDPDAAGRAAEATFLRTALARGPAAARAQAGALEALVAGLEALDARLAAVEVRGAPAGDTVDLAWTPALDDPAWLVVPPARLAAGASRAGGLLLAGPGDARPREARVVGAAWTEAAGYVAGEARAAGEAAVALALAPAPGPALVVVPVAAAGAPDAQPARRVAALPAAGPRVDLALVVGQARRPLALEPGPGARGRVALRPTDRPGAYPVVALDAQGQEVARLAVDLPAVRGVVLTGGPWAVAPGARVEARVVEGGQAVEGRHAYRIERWPAVLVLERAGEVLRWEADQPPGRYRIAAGGAAPADLAIGASAPAVVAVRGPDDPAAGALPAGACGFLRVDGWPTVGRDEVLAATWTVTAGGRARRVVVRSAAEAPALAGLLPVRLDPQAAPGPRAVKVELVTQRGELVVEGRFDVAPAATPVRLELRAPDGEPLRALALGSGLGPGEPPPLVRADVALGDPTWILVSPAGRPRRLAPRFDGQVPLALGADEPPGTWEVWATGTGPDGKPAAGQLAVLAHPGVELALEAPARATTGALVTVRAAAPAGFAGPYRVRRDGGPWTDGLALEVTATQAEMVVSVTLEDGFGRRARGTARFQAAPPAPTEPMSKLRYGIAANVTQRRLFAADATLLQTYRRQGSLPPDWALLELGPLPAAKIRDRMFLTLPYDGPADDAQEAYRSARFWQGLQESARARLRELGVAEGTPFDVLDSPSPEGEETLRALVARLLEQEGGWTFTLQQTRVARAEGAVPDRTPPRDPKDAVRLQRVTASGEGQTVARVEVPGPLGDLQVTPALPVELALGRPAHLTVGALGTRGQLVPGRPYPEGWEAHLPQALLLAELEVTLDVEGRRLQTTARRAGRGVVGVDVAITLTPLATERAPGVRGEPRAAERHAVVLEAFGRAAPLREEVRFEPVPPGRLDTNAPRSITLAVVVRLVPALPAAAWPEGKPRPEPVDVDGVPLLPVRDGLPGVLVELQATWSRQGGQAATPLPTPPPPAGAVRAGSDAPPAPTDAGAQAEAATARALAALARGEHDAAEEAAREATFARPDDARAWAALAEVVLARRRPVEALARARWSLGLAPSAWAWVVAAEAAWADGRVEEAEAAAAAAAGLAPEPALARRLARLREQLGE